MVYMRNDFGNGDHEQRVADLTCVIAEEFGLGEMQICGICMTALLHDIGKIWLRPELLRKPTRLTDVEFGIIRAHPETGYNICKAMGLPLAVAQAVLQHHERIDGSGYPQGLRGEDIALWARILAVADVVEAMTSQRPYRAAHPIEGAVEEIAQNSGSLYDPTVVDVCLELFNSGRLMSVLGDN